jgi:hypothetical protein
LAVDGCTPILALQFARDFELEIEKKKEIEREREIQGDTHKLLGRKRGSVQESFV